MFKRLKNFFFVIKPYWKYGKMYIIVQIMVNVLANIIATYYSTCMNRDIIDKLTLGGTATEVILIAVVYEGI
ncbi:MAG: hypothetical protein LUD43_06415, partial [Firmicutes bacterium]|nr:hypothetical protein [Bacillota bacterium]